VTSITDPDWVPIMKRAAAIVTDHGGRTSHAAIVSRELGLPAIVGTGNATHVLHDQQEVTVSCADGDEGVIYEGIGEIDVEDVASTTSPDTKTIMLNLADPVRRFRWWRLPADGVGLARMEFVVNVVQVHPMALVNFDTCRRTRSQGGDRRADARLREQGRLLRRHARPRPRRASRPSPIPTR
jgi:pyruvate,water dikinase